MINDYPLRGNSSDEVTKRRVVAVSAALGIINSSIAANTNSKDVGYDLRTAAEHVGPLADAIQEAMTKK